MDYYLNRQLSLQNLAMLAKQLHSKEKKERIEMANLLNFTNEIYKD